MVETRLMLEFSISQKENSANTQMGFNNFVTKSWIFTFCKVLTARVLKFKLKFNDRIGILYEKSKSNENS